jgi:hypothetical protein
LELNAEPLKNYQPEHAKLRFSFTYEPLCNSLSIRSILLLLAGQIEQALRCEKEALAYAQSVGHGPTIGLISMWG